MYSNSNYGFHLAGPRGLLLKATKTCFILLNGSVALKFVVDSPKGQSPLQLTPSLPARSLYSKPRGRSTSCEKICLAAFKKRPHAPAR